MTAYKVEICGVNTARLPMLREQEKEELMAALKKGDEAARQKYIKGNLRLVLSVVQRFSASGENLDDLFQIGCIGLIKAIDNFDVNQQVKLSTYAVPMIIGEIRRYLRDNSQIRVSRSLKDTAYKAIYAKERLMKQSQKEPTINEIAAEIGVDKEEIVMALDAVQSPVSLYEPVYCDGGDTLYVMDQVSDTKNVEDNWVSNLALKDAIGRLAPREKEIIRLRFFRGRTQMEVAKEIGTDPITLRDMIKELEKPGRDPREEMPKPVLKSDVLDFDDLKEGMELKGTVRNVIDFGAFVDIGVHQDGLVHISEMSNKFIKHPLDVVSVGDVVDVRVLSVDKERKRIQLSMKK